MLACIDVSGYMALNQSNRKRSQYERDETKGHGKVGTAGGRGGSSRGGGSIYTASHKKRCHD